MKLFKTLAILTLATGVMGCQKIADHYINNYFEKNGETAVEKAIDGIVKKKREEAAKAEAGPSLEERLKNPVTVTLGKSASKGAKDPKIVMVEFSDFQCPFCTRVLPTVEQVMKEYGDKVALHFRHNPLPFHPDATPAAKAAEAAHRQGKFWEMHDILFQNQKELKPENFKKWAKQLKLDLKKFEADMKDEAIAKQIEEDANFARANGAGGTPSFFIGKPDGQGGIKGVLLVGAQPMDKFKEVIDALMKQS